MAAETESFGELLQQFSLEKYYETFASVGIRNTAHLMALTMQDYPTLGITSMHDRRKMFHLIQNVKDKENWTVTRPSISRGGQFTKKKNKEITKAEMLHVKEEVETGMQTPLPKMPSMRLNQRVKTPSVQNFSYGIPSSKLKPSTTKTKLTNESSNIKVCVRKRPLGNDELASGEVDVVNVEVDDNTVVINAPKVAVDLTKYMQKFSFKFDEVFDESLSNHQVYEKTAKPLVDAIFTEGAKATCFAYGCTGSGKTYTMLGTDNIPGLYLLAASDIFNILYSGNHGNGLGLWVSFYEIYCGQLFDLLNDRSKLFARENAAHQVCIVGLTERQVNNVEELMEVIESGGNSRSTGATGVNADSSRSHAILQLDLKHQKEGESIGRFSFIDLAGSERAADVIDSDKQTRMEGAEINQSLLALKECIRSLDQESRHTPFRQSKLTQVLKDSFVGNTRTCMIANVSPCQSSCENTLNTLRYADRVKELNKTAPDPLSPRPVTVHGNHITRITNSSTKNKTMGKAGITDKVSANNNHTDPSDNLNNLQIPSRTPRINTKSRGMDKPFLRSLQIPPNTPKQTSLLSRPETSPAVIKEVSYKPRSRSRLQYLNKEQSYNMLKTNQQTLLNEKQSKDRPLTQQTSKSNVEKDNEKSQRTKPTFNIGKDAKTSQQNLENKTEQYTKIPRQKTQFSSTRTRKSQQVLHDDKIEEKGGTQNGRFTGNRKRANKLEVLPKEQKILNEEKRDRPVTPKIRASDKLKSNSHRHLVHNTQTTCTRAQNKPVFDEKPSNPKVDILKLDNEVDTLISTRLKNNTIHERKDVIQEDKVFEDEKKGKNEGRMRNSLDPPQSNNRYSKGIKARLAQLFTSKSTTNLDVLPDHRDTLPGSSSLRNTRAPLQRGLTESMTHRVISEEQIVAAHHTQLAMVTGLCHEEMVLLKQRDNQDFLEYITQVEELLLQKQTCIANLQEKLRNWKTSTQHLDN